MEKETIERLEGIAFACVLSVLCAVALTKPDIDPSKGMLYWLVFTVFCGLSIDPARYPSLGKLAGYCVLPAGTLVLALCFRGALDIIDGGLGTVASVGSHEMNAICMLKVGSLYILIFIFTGPAITMASLSRGVLLRVSSAIWETNPEKVKALEKTVIIGLNIISILFGAVLAFR